MAEKESHPLNIEMLDTALVSPGDREHLLRYNDDAVPASGGMHAVLASNLWGTAFPQWIWNDGLARFQLNFAA